MQGLLASGLTDVAQGVVRNLLALLSQYGESALSMVVSQLHAHSRAEMRASRCMRLRMRAL